MISGGIIWKYNHNDSLYFKQSHQSRLESSSCLNLLKNNIRYDSSAAVSQLFVYEVAALSIQTAALCEKDTALFSFVLRVKLLIFSKLV